MRTWVKLHTSTLKDAKLRFVIKRYGWDCWGVFSGLMTETEEGTLTLEEEIFADFLYIQEKRFQEIVSILAKYNFIQRNEAGQITLTNWSKYQTSAEEMEEKREADRARQAEWRAKKKAVTKVSQDCHKGVTQVSHASHAIEEELDIEEELEKEIIQKKRAPDAKKALAPDNPGQSLETLDHLYHRLMKAMEDKKGEPFASYAQEGANAKRLIQRVRTVEKDHTEEALRAILETYYRLVKSGDKFWSAQPFTPSRLLSNLEAVIVESKKGNEDFEKKKRERELLVKIHGEEAVREVFGIA